MTGTPQLTLNDGGGGQLCQRQRHGDAHLQLRRRGGPEHFRPGLCLDRRADAQWRHHPDAAGNAATLTLPATGTDGLATQNIVIDTTPRTVTGVSTTHDRGDLRPGTTIPITVTFGEAVTVTGTPQLALNDGAVANYASGSGTTTLTFNYVVAAGQNSGDLDYASTGALSLNGGSIKDAAGNAAMLTLPATGTDGLATQNIVIDTTPPAVSAVVHDAGERRLTGRRPRSPITVTFSEAGRR